MGSGCSDAADTGGSDTALADTNASDADTAAADTTLVDSALGDSATSADAADTSVATCDPALAFPPASGCSDGLAPAEVYCHDAADEVGTQWVCDARGAEGELCRDGNHYVNRPCETGLLCVSELFVSRCRPSERTACESGSDCAAGERCYGHLGGKLVCAPAQAASEECTSFDGDAPPGATAESIQGSCGDGLHCMNGDYTGDFAFCLPTTCSVAADCGASPYWTFSCITAAEAGPGRVPGCAVEAPLGAPCLSGGTPHNGMACAAGTVCAPPDGDGNRNCVAGGP